MSGEQAEEMRGPLWVVEAGTVPYAEAVDWQQRVNARCREGEVPDSLLLLQHPSVITLGRAAHREHLLASPEALARQGVELHEAARGGDVTYHGPGQLVGYPIFDLNRHGRDLHVYLRGVEEALIRALRRFGVGGWREPGLTGVWTEQGKVAAIGVGVRHWVTWHGFALNVAPDLEAFRLIVPCGIQGRPVTSLERLTGRKLDPADAAEAVVEGFRDVFRLQPESRPASDLDGP